MREACATCEMGYVRAIYVFVMRLFLVHIDRHTPSLSNSNLHHPQMAIYAYPGQGLSISQLVFALNEELKRVAYCSS